MSDPSPNDPPVHPLNYLPRTGPAPGSIVRIASYGTADEAELHAAELEAEGIAVQVANARTNALGIPYTGFADVELLVPAEDAARAAEVLRRATAEELEPAEESAGAVAPMDDEGQPLTLVPAAAYETVRQIRDAQTLLASARIRAFLPPMVPRGDRPPGLGKRFVLRVSPDDLERAQIVLQDADEEAGDEEPRCPQCASWRVYPVGHFWKGIGALVGLNPTPADQMECLACRYRGAPEEFKKSAAR